MAENTMNTVTATEDTVDTTPIAENAVDTVKQAVDNRYFSTESLTVGYNGRALISDITLGLGRGEILTLIGPNGLGKVDDTQEHNPTPRVNFGRRVYRQSEYAENERARRRVTNGGRID